MIPHSRPWISRSDQLAVSSALATSMIARGKRVAEFEQAVAELACVDYAVAMSSGSAALALALETLSIGSGDEVIMPTYVCRSVLEAVMATGAAPVVCDVDHTGVLDLATARSKISARTKAVIAVHIFGRFCDIASLQELGVPVIEDACQAFGLRVNGGVAGGLGDIGIYSFHATKCLTTGEGGMLVTANHTIAKRARMLVEENRSTFRQMFAPLSDLQAALGLSQLSRYEVFLERRELIRAEYLRAVVAQGIQGGELNMAGAPFRFTVFSNHPFELLKNRFAEHGIAIRKGVDELLHRLLSLEDTEFPSAKELFEKTVSIPFYPSLSLGELSKVQSALVLLAHEG